MIRELSVSVLRDTIATLLPDINYRIPPDVLAALRGAAAREQSDLGRQTLEQLVRNYEVAAEERMPVCQDSGLTVVMLETGQDALGSALELEHFPAVVIIDREGRNFHEEARSRWRRSSSA